MAERDFEVARVVYSLPEAAVLVSKLQAYGIDAFAMPLHFASVSWHFLVAVGGIEIRVPARRYRLAVQLIADGGPFEAAGEAEMFRRPPLLNGLFAFVVLFGLKRFVI